ncbi:MAG TPA: MmcQ/YjbR family DNA-binding protein [Caulobacteraceae bacterium]|nr:MmcQ/YjbR family DNA-binding protein [Caulobacteraceae bacterium]
MSDAETVRRLALAQPEATDASSGARLAFEVEGRGFAWTFMRRVHPKKPRVPDPEVLAIRCELPRKEMLIEAAPEVFFDDDHYRGFPAVLTRLAAIDEAELAALLAAAWRLQAPKRLGGLAGKRR